MKNTLFWKRWRGIKRPYAPLPTIHDRPSTWRIASSRLAIIMTVIFWALYVVSAVNRQLFEGPQTFFFSFEATGYLIVVTLLTLSALVYLISRQGAFQRFSKHMRVPRAELDGYFYTNQPSVTVLVPSYNEEVPVIRKTLISAALQEYPSLKIVLLIDNSPIPSNPNDAVLLDATRNLGKDTMKLFAEPRKRFNKVLRAFEQKASKASTTTPRDIKTLAGHYRWAGAWLTELSDNEAVNDHVDVFFKEQVLGGLAKNLMLTGDALLASAAEGTTLPIDRVKQLYSRLAWIFDAELSVFERKKYASLSHDANKAMNLNSYIGLMGGSYCYEQTPDGTLLAPVAEPVRDGLTIPESDFLVTLDADSVLLPEYCLRLVHLLEQPDNSRVAVAQTPYSAFPGASSRLERLAGATTDIQHILHQGLTHYGATFWVGANAVIRKRALEDIVKSEWIGGFEIRKYVQDKTVIEDTESSIDLTSHGWALVNYSERLSYSATPPDFGALIIQRRRWATGGILIVPKLWAEIREHRRHKEFVSLTEVLLRLNYLASITWSSVGLVFILAYPYGGKLLSPYVVLAALPYFIAMSSDLKYCGYKRTDAFRIYGFNLMLLSVNLAGVLKSLQQAISGKQFPFGRTPKIKHRTVSPIIFIASPLLIVGFSLYILWLNAVEQNWGNAIFAGFNASTALWATMAYIGPRSMLTDIWHGAVNWLYVDVNTNTPATSDQSKPALDWKAILYHGDTKGDVPAYEYDLDASSRTLNTKSNDAYDTK